MVPAQSTATQDALAALAHNMAIEAVSIDE